MIHGPQRRDRQRRPTATAVVATGFVDSPMLQTVTGRATDSWNDSCSTEELDVVLTMPHAWQVRFNASGITPADRIAEPVDPAIVADLLGRIPDSGRAYEPDGLAVEEFDRYGATVRTLRGFIASYHELVGAVRDLVLPDPDKRPA